MPKRRKTLKEECSMPGCTNPTQPRNSLCDDHWAIGCAAVVSMKISQLRREREKSDPKWYKRTTPVVPFAKHPVDSFRAENTR